MGTVKVTNIEPIADNGTVTLGGSGDTITLGSGATVTGNGLVGITEADQWRLNARITSDGDITSNLERVDNSIFGYVGTGMTESSGIFSFPSTGIYMILVCASFRGASENSMDCNIYGTIDNSNYTLLATAYNGQRNATATNTGAATQAFVNVTDTGNVKVKFNASSISSGSYIEGLTGSNYTSFTFIRLGDSS